MLILKYDNENEVIEKKLGKDIYLFQDKNIMKKIKNKHPLIFKRTTITAKNLSIRNVELTMSLLKTEYGLEKGMIISFKDITETKLLEEELSRRERLASLGQMSAGIAHELRNPLGGIEGFASILEKDLDNDKEKQKLATKILSGVKSLNKIVTSFLDFTSKIKINKKYNNILETIENSFVYIKQLLLEKDIVLEKDFKATKIMLEYDEDKIKQVLLNIFLNAVDALNEIEKPKIKVAVKYKQKNFIDTSTMIIISVFNNGKPLPENQEKIFDPFYTTKSSGIGLGLTISQNIVAEHNGRLNYKNKSGGVEFSIELPADSRFIYD